MIEHDRSKRVGHSGFAHRGQGTAITRTCGRCGNRRGNRGGSWHKVRGWIGECCTKPAKAAGGGK